jgi:hypothetical protein
MPISQLPESNRPLFLMITAVALAGLAIGGVALMTGMAAEPAFSVAFSGGHETEPEDHGRPVVLIAATLGVKPELFREAFRGVTPARGGGPTPEQVRKNKAALMKALGPYGITNERLDEVSDYYRYRPERGELWRTKRARAHAIVEGGKVKEIVVSEPGSGYSTPPRAVIKGMPEVKLTVNIAFDRDLKKNGSVQSIHVSPAD